MIFSEKFIERNIAELSKEYILQFGLNVNNSRISPQIIDGLKVVARRLLYIMYLKDQGKNMRKVAAITGDTISKVHAHGQSSVTDCLVNLEQWWNNNLPLIDGQGNFGCHDDKTQVLTKEGWKYFKYISIDTELATVNPINGEMMFEKPTEIFKYYYHGDMIRGKGDCVDFLVTPNHRMLVDEYIEEEDSYPERNEYRFVNAEDLAKLNILHNEFYYIAEDWEDITITIPEYNYTSDIHTINTNDWLQFLGLFIACGSMNKYPKNIKTIPWINLSIDDKNNFYKVKTILSKISPNIQKETINGFKIYDKRIWELLESYGLYGKTNLDKFIPKFMFELDYIQIEAFLYGLTIGCGKYPKYKSNDISYDISYKVYSKKLAEQIQILILMCCNASSITEKQIGFIKHRYQYNVNLRHHKIQYIEKAQNISIDEYDGMVYCAEVPTYHTLITKRNECILLSGNSISGDPAGADRYILAKLSDYAYDCFFSEWRDSNVDTRLAFDEETMEPLYLPAKYPNILINGVLGIGIGLSTNIPPFNFKEVLEATIKLIKNPHDHIELIPDSPTGCDICGGNFKKIVEEGRGVYSMRSSYEIDPSKNMIRITTIPYQVTVNAIRERIAEIKETKGLPELINMDDASRREADLRLYLRNDVNPYKFIKKLFASVGGLEKSYPVNITVADDFRTFDTNVRDILLEWIKYRREQKRVMVNHRRTSLQAEQRTNDVKIFLMDKNNLDNTIKIFRSSRNKSEIEQRLIEEYKNSEIRMDSLQAKTLSELRMYQLSVDHYNDCLKRREELKIELEAVEEILSSKDGIDQIIIAELRNGIKKFGTPRKSKLVPWKIDEASDIKESCILQLSSNGIINKFISTDLAEEPIPLDTNGYAVRVENGSSFIVIDLKGYHSMIKSNDIPLDTELPINRYLNNKLDSIVALVPFDISSDQCVTLISKKGVLKKFKISDMRSSKKPCISLDNDDTIVKGIVTKDVNSHSDILVFTADGKGQRIDSNDIRITSPSAKGIVGIKLSKEDEISGVYRINRNDEFICYVTSKGRFRLNKSDYLPTRNSKHDKMVKLISLVERDKLISVIGVSMIDKLEAFFDDQTSEIVPIRKMKVSTMSADPVKLTKKSAVSNVITKVKKV